MLLHPIATPLVAIEVEREDAAHDPRLGGIDGQALLALALVAALRCFHRAKAEVWARAVAEALARVLLHRPQRVLAVLLALVFVEQAEDLARHLARGIVGGLLGDRDHPDAGALQPPLVAEKLEQIAEEARTAMHDDRGIGRRVLPGIGDHLLEHRAPIIGGARPGLDVLAGDRQVLRLAVLAQLAQLIGDRQILLGLAGRGHPGIERYGHGGSSPLVGFGIDCWQQYPIDQAPRNGLGGVRVLLQPTHPRVAP